MTARDEAITEIADWWHTWQYGDNGTDATRREAQAIGEYLVRNIRPRTVARLAIEQGALVVHRDTIVGTLYRVVEP